ncbi:MAG: efflux RND transporter periplasmic adaptor subunit [Deltaproteobacteria bacterium]|nr:MAG: efflux RND transporter periplasmic adaptor subunit [Deltaproteobacteria bacterium]
MARRFVPFLVIGVALLAPTPFVADDDAQAAGAPTAERAAPAAEGVRPEEGFARAPIRLDGIQQQAIGLTYGTVERRPLEQVIRTVGRLDYDERKLAEVTLKVEGYIGDLFVDYTGKPVRKGDPLFTIYSPELVTAQEEYLLAHETLGRLGGSNVPSALDSARSLVRASRERLRLWDLTDQQVRALEESRKHELYQTIYSPISGVVIEKMAFKGHRTEPGMPLYKIADLSTIWVYADIYEYELPFVQVGQEARITLAYYPAEEWTARLTYVYPSIDPKTRTAKVRFELPNSGKHQLLPEMYGNVELHVPAGERLTVPETAVLDSGRRQVVFVASTDGQLVPRDVKLGSRFDYYVEVLEGLSPGERVVTSANFLVDSESKLQAAESMMGMMGAIGMGDWKMESARPMEMGGQAGPGQEERRVGDVMVAVSVAAGPAKVGENAIRVRVRDASGAPVKGAAVSFSYTMDMPGMSIEQARAQERGDGMYEGSARFTMAGPWGLVVQIERPGKPPAREKFTLRVSG